MFSLGDCLVSGCNIYIWDKSKSATYHTRSNLWNVLIIEMQDFSHLICSNSWNERIFEKLTILIVGTGNFYSVLFSPAKSFSLVLPTP